MVSVTSVPQTVTDRISDRASPRRNPRTVTRVFASAGPSLGDMPASIDIDRYALLATDHDRRTKRYTHNRGRGITSNVTVRINNKGASPASIESDTS